MPKRVQIDEETGGAFLASPPSAEVFPTGSTILNLSLGGGWAVGGTINVVGDSSTGKTQLATEGAANYAAAFPSAPIRYNDAESAYDRGYGRTLGCPEAMELFDGCSTVENFSADFDAWADKIEDGGRGLYLLDSLDALTDDAELDRDVGEASYGMAKAKLMSEFFRRTVSVARRKKITLFVVSQVRAAIGVSYGEKTTRAGGKALNFYALQIVYLKHLKQLNATYKGAERQVGIDVKAKVRKNKLGPPGNDTEYPIYFSFGIDDVSSMITWMLENKRQALAFQSIKEAEEVRRNVRSMPKEEWKQWRKALRKRIPPEWAEIEKNLQRGWGKYE